MAINRPVGEHRAALRWLVLALLSSISLQPASAAAAAKPGPNDGATVSELIVTASRTVAELTVTAKIKCLAPDKLGQRTERPKVVSTFPAKGAVVRPGLLVIRVTFNQPMACEGALTGAPPLQNPCPSASQQMLLSYDRRTIRTVCIVEPSTQYGIWLSQDPTARSFLGLGGLPSQPYRLSFSTSGEPAVTTVCDAMVQDEDTARQIRKRRTLDCSSENSTSGG
jgi:hypothetical protein